jgi:hypothetical protein
MEIIAETTKLHFKIYSYSASILLANKCSSGYTLFTFDSQKK